MKNTRTGQRTIRKLLKGAGSAILLATLFVLVFAGTLSGAFGIEENLQQNGIIESNVAAATTISGNTMFTKASCPDRGDRSTLENSSTYKYQDTLTNYVDGMWSGNTALDYAYWVYYDSGHRDDTNGIYLSDGSGAFAGKYYKPAIRWNVKITGQLYRAYKNGAFTTATFKATSYSNGNSDPRSLAIFGTSSYGTPSDDIKSYSGSQPIGMSGRQDGGTLTQEVTVNINQGTDDGSSVQFWLELRLRVAWGNNVGTAIHSLWIDFNRVDNTAPTITHTNGSTDFMFNDATAGVYKIYASRNGGAENEITAGVTFNSNTRTATWTADKGGVYKFRVIDNVGNVLENKYEYVQKYGTKTSSPFELTCREDFETLSYAMNGYGGETWVSNGFSGSTFNVVPNTDHGQGSAKYGLAANKYINMLGTAFTPIADYGTSTSLIFRGTINGNNCSLVDFVVNATSARSALIGTLGDSGKISNFNIGCANASEQSSVTSTKSDSAAFVGFLNNSSAVVENCSSYATISGTYQNGGIVANIGSNGGTISNCHNYGAVSGTYSIGGIVGIVQGANGKVENCVNSGPVSGAGNDIGGIVGNMKAGTLKGSISNNGNVTSNRTASYGDVAYSIISSRSGDYSGNQGLAKINDGNAGSKYYSSPTNISFVLDVNSAMRINGFAITNGDDNNSTNANQQNRTVKGVYIWGSNSNDSGTSNTTGVSGAKPTTANWNLIYSTANLPNMGTANSTRYNFSFNNFTQYRYYWVYLESRGQGVQLSEFDLRSNDLQSSTGGIAGCFKGSTANGASLTNAGTVTSSGYNVGGIFGYLESNVSINATFNVTSTGGDSISGLAVVGGAFGFVNSTATVNGTIVVNAAEIDKETGGNYCFGGAIGYNAGTIGASITVTSRVIVRSSGSVNGYIAAFAGGIVGYNEGTISGTTEKTGGDVLDVSKAGIVGGLAGFNSGTLSGGFTTIITQPRDDAFKVIDGGENVGGAVGYNLGNLTGTYNINTLVRGTNYVGGFIGYNGKGGLEINGYTNNSQVSGNNYVGGIVGGTYATLTIKIAIIMQPLPVTAM